MTVLTPLPAGAHTFGPENATVSVRTGRSGAAAKAGHDLVIQADTWQATLIVGGDLPESELRFESDASSLRVIEGTGGMQALDDADKANIAETIVAEILTPSGIAFHSTSARFREDGAELDVEGELTLAGQTRPIAFNLQAGEDGKLHGRLVIKQSDWGIKPYSALFGALKVADEVEICIDAH